MNSTTEEEILTHAREAWRVNHEHFTVWREEAKEDYDFVAGDQWSDTDKQVLEREMRPPVVFNRVAPTIEAIAGQEVNSRQEVIYMPREVGDAAANEVLTAAAQWVRDNCDAADEESDAFLDSVICGVGCTETKLSYETNLDGDIIINRVDPLELWPDAHAKKRNYADARNILRAKDYTLTEFEEQWPDADLAEADSGNTEWGAITPDPTVIHDNPQDQYAKNDAGTAKSVSYIRVVEFQWYDKEDVFRLRNPQSGEMDEIDTEEFGERRVAAAEMGVKLKKGRDYAKQKKRVYKRAFLAGSKVLEHSNNPSQVGFTYEFITGKRDRNRNTFYGIVRAMKDPQRWANKFFSQIMHIINTNAKGGVILEEGAVSDQRKFEEDWSRPDSNVTVTDINKIKEKGQSKFPVGIDRMMEFSISSIRDVTGINLEFLGMADREQSGVLEETRKKAGMAILATTFDALKRYRKMQGRVMLFFIQSYISDGRLVRVVGQENAQYVPLIKQPGLVEFDVIVDDSPDSPNQKQQIWGVIERLMPTIIEMPAAQQLLVEALKYSPLPASLAAKAQEILKSGYEPSEAETLETEQAKADVELTKSQAQENHADIAIKTAKAQAAGVEAQVKQGQAQHEGMLGTQQLQLDQQKAQQDFVAKMAPQMQPNYPRNG